MKPHLYVFAILLSLPFITFSQTTVATEITEKSIPESTINVHSNCLKHFSRSFKNATNQRWSENNEGYSVHFSENGISYNVRYTQRGRWITTISYIPVNLLNKDVAQTVLYTYRHYNIFFAQKVSVPAGSVYFVKIEKGNEWKFLKVMSREIEVLGEYIKESPITNAAIR